jgi:phosphatidylglycerophosphatase A
MAIKESSDELNPAVIAVELVGATPRPARSTKDYLALGIATCGVGYLPLAPGTWGSLVGIGLYFLVRRGLISVLFGIAPDLGLNNFHLFYVVTALEILFVTVLSLIGFWSASRTEKLSAKKDPGKVVIDEVAGQFIALIPVPFVLGAPWWTVVVAFILFRFFDIVKPYPARRLESLPGGLGIMADDLVAGIYAALVVMLTVCASWIL